MSSKIINSIEEFFNLLDNTFDENHEEYSKYGKWKNPNVKTYLIEANEKAHEKITSFEVRNNINISKDEKNKYILFTTETDNFFRLEVKNDKNNNKNEGFLDTSNERYWKYYALSKSEYTDRFVHNWVDNTIYLDRCWQISDMLNKYEKQYIFRGTGLSYENIFNSTKDNNRISMKLWTRYEEEGIESIICKKINELLRDDIHKDNLRFNSVDEDDNLATLNEIYFNGKITTTTAKAYHHLDNVLNDIINNYENIISIIEERKGPLGDPIEISYSNTDLNKKVVPLDKKGITDYFSKDKQPFRLFLHKIYEINNFISLAGIDLHTNQEIGMDIGDDFIYINIPESTCGNAGVRIPTLLDKHLPGKRKITIGGESLIG